MSANTTPLGPFVGMNNRLPDHQLGVVERGRKAGDYLRNAVNVDLTASGTLQRRKGVTLTQAGGNCHSLWGDEQGAFYVDNGTIYAYPRTPVRSDLSPTLPVSYARMTDGAVVWSNAAQIERITDGASLPLALETPNPAPSVSAQGGGGLPAGLYQVAVTRTNAEGEESAPTWPVQVQAGENGKIVVEGLPGELVNIYVSPPNGDVLFLAVTTSATGYTFWSIPTQGPQLQTLGLRAIPAGHIVRTFRSRLLVAAGAVIYVSEPFSPLYDPMRGYVPLPSRVTMVAPAQAGVYVATAHKTYWLSGENPDDAQLVEMLPYGAPEGTATGIENTNDVAWFSTRGLVIGTQDGQVKNVQEDVVSVGKASSGATLFREQDGMRQLISTLFGSEGTRAAASSYFEADVVRKENMQ